MNHRSALFAAFFAFAQIACANAAEPQTPSAQPDAARSYGGNFILVDHHGETLMDEAFRGKFMLISFGYTHCPDICPTLLADMANAMKLLGADGAAVQPLFVTLDPARDTPKVLAEYVASFSPRLIGLTGPDALIADIAEKYRIKFEKQPGKNGDYSIDHTAAIFLMDRDGRFLDRFASGTPAKKIAEKIREHMKASAQ